MTPAEQLRARWADPEGRTLLLEACSRGGRRAQARRRTRALLTERSMPHHVPTTGGERLLRAVVRVGIEPTALPVAAALVAELDAWALERHDVGEAVVL